MVKIMQKNRRGIKYNQMRHSKDAMYSYYAFKTFLNKLTRQGRAASGQRHTEQALKGCKLAVPAPAL